MKLKPIIVTILITACILGGCSGYPADSTLPATTQQTDTEKDTENNTDKNENHPTEENSTLSGNKEQAEKPSTVDVVFFMGESNMSGFGGDASLAPIVSEDAGVEFRAVSDPTKLYPISEPFGKDENDPDGLNDFPGAKKGALVSSFVNKYHELTGRRIVAVSASMGSADMDKWTSDGVMTDVKNRFDTMLSFLEDNDYKTTHIYAVWLQGESDGLKGSAESTYKDTLDKFMKPLFKSGLEKVFIIVPGRTIDYTDIYQNVINAQIDMCTNDDHYALATTVLTKVNTEFMTDQYQYNQHVLNYVGGEAAKSVAFFTENGVKKIVYDYKQGKYIVPKGIKEGSQDKDALVYPSELDINSLY